MQAEVGWDPISVGYANPIERRLFVLYLLVVLCIVAVKSLKLAWNLWSFRTKKRRERLNQSTGVQKAKLLAQFALANNFWWIYEREAPGTPGLALQQAESTFLYRFDVWSTTTTSIMRLSVLTIMIAATTFCIRMLNVFSELATQKVFFGGLATGGLAEAFSLVALGLSVSALFYLLYMFFEGALRKRKLVWNRICREASESAL